MQHVYMHTDTQMKWIAHLVNYQFTLWYICCISSLLIFGNITLWMVMAPYSVFDKSMFLIGSQIDLHGHNECFGFKLSATQVVVSMCSQSSKDKIRQARQKSLSTVGGQTGEAAVSLWGKNFVALISLSTHDGNILSQLEKEACTLLGGNCNRLHRFLCPCIHSVHSDLKPDDIMLVNHKEQPFRVRLKDFGVSFMTSEEARGLTLWVTGRFSMQKLICWIWQCSSCGSCTLQTGHLKSSWASSSQRR